MNCATLYAHVTRFHVNDDSVVKIAAGLISMVVAVRPMWHTSPALPRREFRSPMTSCGGTSWTPISQRRHSRSNDLRQFELTVSVLAAISTIRSTTPSEFARLCVRFSIGSSFPSLLTGNPWVSQSTAKFALPGTGTHGIWLSFSTMELPSLSWPVTMRRGSGNMDILPGCWSKYPQQDSIMIGATGSVRHL